MTPRSDQRDELVSEFGDRFIDMLRIHEVLGQEGLEIAFRAVPRHRFVRRYLDQRRKKPRMVRVNVDRPTPAQLSSIYRNHSLTTHRPPGPISTVSQPSLVAQMLSLLDLKPGMNVLEIGAGSGWNAALIAHLVGTRGRISSVELVSEVAAEARRAVAREGYRNVEIVTGNGANGHAGGAPFDRIISTVGSPDIFPTWVNQVKEGGKLLVPLQAFPHGPFCLMSLFKKRGTHLVGDVHGHAWFILLQGEDGAGADVEVEVQDRLKTARGKKKGRKKLAPWACVHPGAIPHHRANLLFMAYLEGMRIEQHQKTFLLSSPDADGYCIVEDDSLQPLGRRDVHDQFMEIAEQWLASGAPGVTNYRIEVWPRTARKRRPRSGWLVEREHSKLILRLKN